MLVVGLVPVGRWWWDRHRDRELREAEAALARYDLEGAAGHLDAYLGSHPHDANAWLLAARTARRLERFGEAERALERCQEIGGVTAATRLEWDLLRVQQGDTTGIDARLRQTVGPDHPDAPLVLEALARGYLRAERLPDALQACDLLIALRPDHPWPWLWRGRTYERLYNLGQAEADFRRAVECAPGDPEARLALAALLLRVRQPAAAADQFESVLDRVPGHTGALVGLARCRIQQGRAAEAVPLLDRVLGPNPKDAGALFLRGRAALEQNQPAQAEPYLQEAVRAAPNDPEALYQLAQALRALRREDEAAAAVARADRLRADYGRLDELIRLAAGKPDDPAPRYEAGVLALRLGYPAEGVRWLNSVLALRPDHRAAHAALADYYLQAGDRDRAETHRRLAETP